MFRKKTVKGVIFLTRDEQGRLELWKTKPEFVSLENGESFFVDQHEPENQIYFETPMSQSIVKRFLLEEKTCWELKIVKSKKKTFIRPSRIFNYE